jgi:tRNA(Ser,Leu) C12 N-acetylase TAN1
MHDWNVVVSLQEGGYTQAWKLLEPFGAVSRTPYYNVLVMRVADIGQFLETLRQRNTEEPQLLTVLARVMPVTQTFTFQTVEEFETKVRAACQRWVPVLAGQRFHVRMHRRGFKGRLTSQHEESFLDGALLEALAQTGRPGQITFADPDAIIALETVDCRAGLALWRREDVQRYPFLRLD